METNNIVNSTTKVLLSEELQVSLLQHTMNICGVPVVAILEGSDHTSTITLQKFAQRPFDTEETFQLAKEDLERRLLNIGILPTEESIAELNLSFVSMMFHISTQVRDYSALASDKRKAQRQNSSPNANAGQFKGLQFVQPRYHVKSEQFEKQWRQNYELLKKFKEQHGHVNVTRVTKGYEHLGVWVADQRKKLRAGKMTRQRYDLLNDIGMEWDRSYYFKPSVYRNDRNNNDNKSGK